MGDFRRLTVWQRARELTVDVYHTTTPFPSSEHFGLVSQMRRSAASIARTVAESCGRFHRGDETRFLLIARGSANELQSHLIIAHDLTFLSPADAHRLTAKIDEVQRLLAGLIRKKRTATRPASSL